MNFKILYDADWEAKLDKVLSNFSDKGFKLYFEKKEYGSSLDEIVVILMCRNPDYNFNQRIRFSKKEKTLYLDIMLNLNQFKELEQTERNRLVSQRLFRELPPIIAKYKLESFDLEKFEKDLQKWLKKYSLL